MGELTPVFHFVDLEVTSGAAASSAGLRLWNRLRQLGSLLSMCRLFALDNVIMGCN